MLNPNYGYDIATLRKRNFDRFDSGSTEGTDTYDYFATALLESGIK